MTVLLVVAGLAAYCAVMLMLAAGMRGDSSPRPRTRSTGHAVGRWQPAVRRPNDDWIDP